MKMIIAVSVAALAVGLAPAAHAGTQDDVLCSSNGAYRTTHKADCKDIALNSHGGGGAPNSDTPDRGPVGSLPGDDAPDPGDGGDSTGGGSTDGAP